MTAREAWTTLPLEDEGADLSDIDRGTRAFALTVHKRKLNPTSAKDPKAPVVVLFPDNWRPLGKTNKWQHLPEVDDGSRQLTGYLFVAPPNLGAAYAIKLPTNEMGDIVDWIEDELKLGTAPAILMNPDATVPELRVYVQGVSVPTKKSTYPLCLAELNCAALDGLLLRFWRDVVCAPGGGRKCQKLWQNRQALIPVKRPEKIVQDEMCRYLNRSLPGLRAKDEENVELGRLDVRLLGPASADHSIIVHHAVIELKVLTKGNTKPPFTDTKTVRCHVKEGVRQAASYRKPPEASRIAMLACYDMRHRAGERGETCFDHVTNFAKKEAVEIRRWPLFPSVGELRKFKTPDC